MSYLDRKLKIMARITKITDQETGGHGYDALLSCGHTHGTLFRNSIDIGQPIHCGCDNDRPDEPENRRVIRIQRQQNGGLGYDALLGCGHSHGTLFRDSIDIGRYVLCPTCTSDKVSTSTDS